MIDGRPGKAFTLAEVVVALSITATIGLTVTTITFALSKAQDRAEALTDGVQLGRGTLMQLGGVLRKTSLVLYMTEQQMTLWGDADGDGKIGTNELTLLEYRPDTGTLEHGTIFFPAGTPLAVLTAINLERALAGVTGNIAAVGGIIGDFSYEPYRQATTLATGLRGLSMGSDAAPPLTRLVRLEVTVGPADRPITLAGSVRLRADAVGRVLTDGTTYTLKE